MAVIQVISKILVVCANLVTSILSKIDEVSKVKAFQNRGTYHYFQYGDHYTISRNATIDCGIYTTSEIADFLNTIDTDYVVATFYIRYVYELMLVLVVLVLHCQPKGSVTHSLLKFNKISFIMWTNILVLPSFYAVKGEYDDCFVLEKNVTWYINGGQRSFFYIGFITFSSINIAFLILMCIFPKCTQFVQCILLFSITIFNIYGSTLRMAFKENKQLAWDIVILCDLFLIVAGVL